MEIKKKYDEINKSYSLHRKDFFHSKTVHTKNLITNNIESFPVARKILNKDRLLLNEDLIVYQNHQKIEKIYQLSEEIEFISFLTLTKKGDLDIKYLLNKIKESYRNKFDLQHLTKIYKSEIKAREKLEKNIIKYSKLDAIIWINSKIRNKAMYLVASAKKINFKNIDDIQIRKYEINKFKEKNKLEIDKKYNDIKNKEFEKQFFEEKTKICEFQIRKNLENQTYYFWTLEYTKSENEHLHIILNKYIPKSLILEITGDKYIFDEKFLYNSLIDDKSNSIYFLKFSNTLKKYEFIESNLIMLKKNQIKTIINYISKYLIKDVLKTHKIKLKLNRNINLSQFSSNCYKDFKHIFEKQKSSRYYIGKSTKIINCLSNKIKIDFDFQQIIKNKNLSKNELDNFKDQENKQSNIINDILFELGYYKKNINNDYLEIYEKYIELFYFLDIDYNEISILKHIRKKGYQGQNFFKQIKKLIICEYLEIFSKKKINYNFDKYHNQLIENLNPSQKIVMEEIIQNNITLLKGSAGCGKTYVISKLQYLSNEYEVIYLNSKSKPSSNLRKEIKELGFKNIQSFTISKFLEKRHNSYYLNSYNCKKYEKPLILIVDEIGQVNYIELNQLLSVIKLNSLCKIIFSGDEHQEKAFFGNNLIYDLSELKYINISTLTQVIRQKTKETINIVQDFKKDMIIHYDEIFDFYENKEKLKNILKEKLNEGFVFLVNSRRLRNYINELCDEISNKKIYIVDKNFKHNEQKFVNGDIFELIEKKELTSIIIDEQENKFEISNFYLERYFLYGYCMTIDKVQALGFENVCIFYDNFSKKLLSQNKFYTGITRSKNKISIYFQNKKIIDTIKNTKNQNSDLITFRNYYKLRDLEHSNYSNLKLSPPSGI